MQTLNRVVRIHYAPLAIAICFIIMGPLYSAESEINVVTTTPDLKSITESIGGDRVKVTSIATGYQDPHFVEAKPSYMIKTKNADLFIRIGLELEIGWEQLIIEGSRNS